VSRDEVNFTEVSREVHHANTRPGDRRAAMKENTTKIVIPIETERLKLWTRRVLETATWLISLGLLAASAAVAGIAVLLWLMWGSETLLALGLFSGIVLGLAGVWHLMRLLDQAAGRIRHETPHAG
jgi:hypothetical protein